MERKCSSSFIRVVCSFHYQWIHFIRNVKKKNIVVMSFIYLVTKKNRSYSIWWRFFFFNDTCGKKEKNEEQAAKKRVDAPGEARTHDIRIAPILCISTALWSNWATGACWEEEINGDLFRTLCSRNVWNSIDIRSMGTDQWIEIFLYMNNFIFKNFLTINISYIKFNLL